MANSKITIVFNSIPLVDQTLKFRDTFTSQNFNEVFKVNRLGNNQVKIPTFNLGLYEITYNEMADTSNIGVAYNDGTYKVVSIDALESDDNGGNRTSRVYSNYTPSIVDMNTQQSIVWGEGSFVHVEDSYTGFLSTNFTSAFNLDYNISNLFTVTALPGLIGTGLGTVIIEANYAGAVFEEVVFTADATVIIENEVADPFLLISSIISKSDTDVCGRYKVMVETNKPIDTVLENGVIVSSGGVDSFYEAEFIRGVATGIELREEPRQSRGALRFPINGTRLNIPKLLSEYFNINVITTLAGSRITVESNFPQGSTNLDLEYSLDNIDWTTSNTFTGLDQGDFTIYIRDSELPSALNLGCSISIDFTIDETGSRAPYVKISKANSINYSLVEDVDNCSIFRNDENSLSFQSLSQIKYCDEILLNKCDTVTTQIHSNYKSVTASLRNNIDDTEVDLNVIKRSNNLNRFKRMDALMFSYEAGISAIYFQDGNTYDELGFVNGSYSLLGNLPDFAKTGNIINIDGIGYFNIIDVIFDFDINKKMFLVQHTSSQGLPTPIIVESMYDLLNFEVYEFDLSCLFLANGIYDIVITNSNLISNQKDVIFMSENIYVSDFHPETLHIMYFGKNNRDIFYKYGIKNFLRARYNNVVMNLNDDVKTISIDDNTSVTKSTVKDGNTFIFDEVPRDFAFKLIIALSLEYVFINGVGYSKKGNINYEVIPNTNLYSIEAEMIKSGIIYTNIGAKEEFIDIETGEQINFPRIITDGTNFIKA